jgi:hypothetical protein
MIQKQGVPDRSRMIELSQPLPISASFAAVLQESLITRLLTSSILRPIADVVLGRVVVPPVYLPKPRTVKVN